MKVLIVFYSRYGNTAKLAEGIAEGALSIPGTEVVLKRVAETSSPTIINRDARWHQINMELQAKYPLAEPTDLEQAEAIVFGSANRFGNMSAELKLFVDKTGPQWVKGSLIGKVGAVFTTNSTAHSGKESTLLSMMIPLLHHGMIIVGVPPNVPETARAGSYYGATATTGPGADRAPTPDDLAVARALGRRVAEVAQRLLRGKAV